MLLPLLDRERKIREEEDAKLEDDGDNLFCMDDDGCGGSSSGSSGSSGSSPVVGEETNVTKETNLSATFPPAMPDQVLCKENQRNHMKLQRESWMKQKRQAEEEKNPTIHPSPGYSFIVSSPQRMQRPSNARDENERLYDHWYQRASDWQKSTTTTINTTTDMYTQIV